MRARRVRADAQRPDRQEEGPDWFTVAWITWIAAFAVVEAVALLNDRAGDTLSEHVWRWFSVRDRSTTWNLLRFGGLIGGLTWVYVHFVSGGVI